MYFRFWAPKAPPDVRGRAQILLRAVGRHHLRDPGAALFLLAGLSILLDEALGRSPGLLFALLAFLSARC